MNNIVGLITLGFFILVVAVGIIKSLKDILRTSSFIKTKAKIIDKVKQYTEEWGKYYPDMWDKSQKVYSTLDKVEEKMAKVEELRSKVPFSISKNGISVHLGDNSSNEKEIDDNSEAGEAQYVFICEYEVDGKTYYYEKFCEARDSLKRNLNKEIDIKYDSKKPSYALVPKQSLRTLFMCLFFEIFFIVLFIAVLWS